MSIESAYHMLFLSALVVFGILIGIVLIRSIIGPRITDRIMCINMIGTMVICCILILSVILEEGYLLDVAMIYAMISFIAVLMMATIYIPRHPTRAKFGKAARREIEGETLPEAEAGAEKPGTSGMDRKLSRTDSRKKDDRHRRKKR